MTSGLRAQTVTMLRLTALEQARISGKQVIVPGSDDRISVIIDNGLRYSILMRHINGRRVYNLICPKNGRIIGPSCRSWRGVISDWKKRAH